MVPLNQKAFWIYVISGCAMVLAGWCLTQSQGYRIFPSREYVQFQQATKEYQSARDAWTKETNQWGQLRSSWRKRRDIWQQQRAAWEQWSSDHFVQFEQRRLSRTSDCGSWLRRLSCWLDRRDWIVVLSSLQMSGLGLSLYWYQPMGKGGLGS